MLLIGLALITLLASTAFAECNYEDEASKLLSGMAAPFSVHQVMREALKQKSGWLADGSYRTIHGLIIAPSCFSKTASKREQAEQYERTIRSVMDGVGRCRSRRLMSAAEQLFQLAVSKSPRISCVDGACGSDGSRHAAACAFQDTHRINFEAVADRADPSLWFHELLHLGQVDNQPVEKHNRASPWLPDLSDEVYFWQNHCFRPQLLVGLMRGSREYCRKERKSPCTDYLELCTDHARKNEGTRFSYNDREQGLSCLFYDAYFAAEERLLDAVDRTLVPAAMDCRASVDKIACPAFNELFARGNPSNPAAALLRSLIENRNAPEKWVRSACPEKTEYFGAASVASCAQSLADGLGRPDSKLSSALARDVFVSPTEIQSLRDYFRMVEKKGLFISGGPSHYKHFPRIGADRAEARQFLAEVLHACATPVNPTDRSSLGLAGTSVCLRYKRFVEEPMTLLLKYWE